MTGIDKQANGGPSWRDLAMRLGTLRAGVEHGGDDYGRLALVELLGADMLKAAVDCYLNGEAGSELARSVLHVLRAEPAADRCLEIYQSDADPGRRALAVELLRVVASERHLPWVLRFFDDHDPAVQSWGAGVLESIWNLGVTRWEALEPYVVAAKKHSNPDVRRLTSDLGHLA